jgi:hypothetical protein
MGERYPPVLRDASRVIADASRVIDIDRTLAGRLREHGSASPDHRRPPPGTPVEHRIGRTVSVH